MTAPPPSEDKAHAAGTDLVWRVTAARGGPKRVPKPRSGVARSTRSSGWLGTARSES
jgi:hypothetical protein